MPRDFARIDYEDMNKKELQDLYRDMAVIVNKRISNYNKSFSKTGKHRKSFEDISYEMMEKLGQGRKSEEYVSLARMGMGKNKLKDRIRTLQEFFAYDKISAQAKKEIDKNRINQYKGMRAMYPDMSAEDFNSIMDVMGSLSSSELESLGYAYLSQTFMDRVKGTDIDMVGIINSVMRDKQFNSPRKIKDEVIKRIKKELK